jgi:hypothetical protein
MYNKYVGIIQVKILNIFSVKRRDNQRKKKFWEELIAYLLSFDTIWTAERTTPPTILRYRGNVFTEPLPGNDKGIYKHTHRLSLDTTRTV